VDFFDKVNDHLEKVMIETLLTHGIEEEDIDDDKITKKVGLLPYEFSYSGKPVLTINFLGKDENQVWKVGVVMHKKDGDESKITEI